MFFKFNHSFFNIYHVVYIKAYQIQSNERIGYWIEMLTDISPNERYYERFNEDEEELFLSRRKELYESLKISES